MKKIKFKFSVLFILFGGIFLLSGCGMTEPTPVVLDDLNLIKNNLSPEEEAALIAYKKTMKDRPVMFAWMNFSPETPSMETRISGIPDSVDIVSYFTGYVNNEQNRRDVKFLQERRGTKVVMTLFADDHFKQRGWGEDDPILLDSMRSYATALADSINAWGLDGFDLDYEPSYGHTKWSQEMMRVFIGTMGKYFGPESGTGKLLMVDGEWFDAEYAKYLDYFVSQAYNTRSPLSLDGRAERARAAGIPSEKLIFTEWTSQPRLTYPGGGVRYAMPDGEIVPSLWGMAQYKPKVGERMGGCGVYVLQFAYSQGNHLNKPVPPNNYYYVREAIQLMNPAKK